MQKKIFFLDLDGTTLRDDKTISDRNREALQKAIAAGSYVAVSTGRAIASAEKIVRGSGLALPGCYIIAYNGGTVYDSYTGSILRKIRLPISCAKYLYREAHAAGIYVQTYSDTHILSEAMTKELEFYIRSTDMPYRIGADLWSMLDGEPPKMMLIDTEDKSRLDRFREEHLAWEQGKCISFFSCLQYLEYCPLGGTKGDGVDFLSEYLQVPREHTVAVGDQENDISMLVRAGVGIAMKNADEKAKAAADEICEYDNNHDGVAAVIEKYL